MTSWYLNLHLLVAGVTIARADDVIFRAMNKVSVGKHGCELPENVDLNTQCSPARLDEIRRLPARTVPPGVVCQFGDKKFIYTCSDQGVWIQGFADGSLEARSPHHREKRSWMMVLIAAGGKNMQDLMKNMGLMKQLLCQVMCKKRPKPRIATMMPPQISCPKVPSPQHPLTGATAKVTWEMPFASDRLEGPLDAKLFKGKPPGSSFEEGKHFIHYTTKNSKGLAAYCTIEFAVTLSRCPRLKWPWNGKMKCDNEQISGSVCTFTCNVGYVLDGEKQTMCLKETWVGTVPKCKLLRCPQPPAPENGKLDCSEKEYQFMDTCTITCNPGHVIDGPAMLMCNSTGTWTKGGQCKDSKAPSFPDGCGEDLHAFAESRDQPAKVTWESPKTADNSGGDVTIKYSLEPGSKFPLGRTVVTVKAADKSGNGVKCQFNVFVEAQTCKHPSTGDTINAHLLMYDCPNGTSLGWSCHASCKSDYPLVGASTVTCEKDPNTEKLIWTRASGKKRPYCKTTDCPPLRTPINGAITCDKWNHGRMCSMHCHGNYDVPQRVPTPWYVCGMTTGQWRPHGIVQDCIVRRKPNKMRLPAEMYYYSSSCPDKAALKEMSEKFISTLKKSPLFKEECGERVPECKPESVGVRCGDVRAKRDVTSVRGRNHVHKRSKEQTTIIDFKISIPFRDFDHMNGSDTAHLYKKMLKDISSTVEELVKSNKLEMDGFTVKGDSFAPAEPTVECPKGTKPRIQTGSCVGCPTGTYYNETTDFCEGCPKGTYQDEAYSTQCKACPEGQTTPRNGSRTRLNCTDACPPGSYSEYGVVPCLPCPVGTYQDGVGQSRCRTCDPGLTTLDLGVNTSQQCVEYDMKISPDTEVILGQMKATQKLKVSVYTWVKFKDGVSEATLLKLKDLRGVTVAVKMKNKKLSVQTGNEELNTDAEVVAEKWYHMALVLDSTQIMINLYINDELVLSKVTTQFPMFRVNTMINATTKVNELLYSGLNVVERALSKDYVKVMSKSCTRAASDSIFTPNMTAGKINSPSHCDAIDECSSKPCGKHECTNLPDGFKCTCADGYKGDKCEVAPDPCVDNMCQNGATCVAGSVNYTCQCTSGFKGSVCEQAVVNGEWSKWSPWSFCTQVCGGGTRDRTRTCDNPPPDSNGAPCKGKASEEEKCNTKKCRVCSPLKRSYGLIMDCKTKADKTKCTIKCRDDLVFSETPLPTYECGANTGYRWNHQTDADPEGRLPACTTVQAAKAYTMRQQLTLPTLPCTPDSDKNSVLSSSVASQTSQIACVKAKTCKPVVDVRKCPTGRGRRGAGTSVGVTLTVNMAPGASLDLGKLLINNTMTIGMKKYLKAMLTFEQSAQELVNTSAKVFSVTIHGVRYHADVNSATTDVAVVCNPGEVENEGACTKCAAGSRERKGSCVLCRKGYYQDLTGARTCKPCPRGKTTLYVGAQKTRECIKGETPDSVDDDIIDLITTETTATQEKPDSDHTLIIVLSVMITAMVISITVAAIIWIIKMKKLPTGSVTWGDSSNRNKINPQGDGDNAPPPYPAVYVPPHAPPPYTPMDSLMPATTTIRPNSASDVMLRVMPGTHPTNVTTSPAATQTSLAPTPETSPRSSRNPSPNRMTGKSSPNQSRSPSPAGNLAMSAGVTAPGLRSASVETRNLGCGITAPGHVRPTNMPPSPSRQRSARSRSPSPAPHRSPSSAPHVAPTPPPATYYTPDHVTAPVISPVRKMKEQSKVQIG